MMFFCMCCGQAKKQTQKQISQSSTQLLNTGVKHFRGPAHSSYEMNLYGFAAVNVTNVFFFFFPLFVFVVGGFALPVSLTTGSFLFLFF